MKLYKVLGKGKNSCNGGSAVWTPGKWMPKLNGKEPCEPGMYHLCRLRDLPQWIGEDAMEIWEAEARGETFVHEDSKVCCHEARITNRVLKLDDKTKRLLACDFAELALRYAPDDIKETLECAIYVSRCYADGQATDEELDAAWAAAWAARDAARAAAWAARDASAAARDASAAAWEEMGKIIERYFHPYSED